MTADWEVEIGGGAPVIEADWPGFVDLRADPARIGEVAEAVEFQRLAHLLMAINATGSPFWTSKCDLWQPDPLTLACYVDVLPRENLVFADWRVAESFCRSCVARINTVELGPSGKPTVIAELDRSPWEDDPEISINLIVRSAIAVDQEGFAVTAYLSAEGSGADDARAALAHAMDIFADALLAGSGPAAHHSTLK